MSGDDDTDRQVFAEYFAAHREPVRRTAYLICGDWHWADDLTQTAFIRLAQGWHRIRDPLAVDAYLRTCLIRAYLGEVRRMWRRREQPVAEAPERPEVGDDAEDAHRRERRRRETNRFIAEAPRDDDPEEIARQRNHEIGSNQGIRIEIERAKRQLFDLRDRKCHAVAPL
jgi:DNA-directed RNA polymerase specialized sigma24 family protein